LRAARYCLFTAGALNAFFGVVHLGLGIRLHGMALVGDVKALAEMLNFVAGVYVLALALACFSATTDLLSTRLGTLILASTTVVYAARAAAEGPLFPGFSWAIFILCLFAAVLHAAPLVLPRRIGERVPRQA
jgi:hypothetical protein